MDIERKVIVPEEIFSVAPGLDFDPCRVIQKPRGKGLEWISGESAEICGAITLLTDVVSAGTLDGLPGLRVIANCAVGTDNIDTEAATSRGVWVTNTPGVLTEATADLTWALILAVARRVPEGSERLARGEFSGWELDYLLGLELTGRTLGIVGAGRIGTAVARRASAFGMGVAYSSRRRSERFEKATAGRFLGLDDLLAESDVVSLHVPLDSTTRHMIGEREMGLMKVDAVLVNSSRGGLIDQGALIRVLKDGRLSGAGLDAFEGEPDTPVELMELPNVIVTPHIGSATRETREKMARTAHDNLLAVLGGKKPPDPVNQPDKPL